MSLVGLVAVQGAVVTFTGATSSELTTPTNYSTGALPASGDTLQFDGTAAGNLALTYTTATSNTLGGAAGMASASTTLSRSAARRPPARARAS